MKNSMFHGLKLCILMVAFAFLFHPGDAFAESTTPPDVEGADTLATAIEIKPNTYIKGTVQHIDDVDYYKFTTTDASTEYYVYTTEPNDGSMASSMKLCNERGSSVEDYIVCSYYKLEPNTTYYMKAGEENPTAIRRDHFNYTFFIYKKVVLDGYGDTPETAVTLEPNKQVKRNGVWGKDYYKIDTRNASSNSRYNVNLNWSNEHIYAWMTGADGKAFLEKNLDNYVGFDPKSGIQTTANAYYSLYRDKVSENNLIGSDILYGPFREPLPPGHIYYVVVNATCADYSLTFTKTQAASKVTLNKTKSSIYVGKSDTLKISGTKAKVTWKSSNKKIATVSSKGKVTAKKPGKATITAKVSGKTYKCVVTVKEKSKLNATNISLYAGTTYTLKVSGTKSTVKWSTNDKKIATVNSKGKVTVKKKGSAIITAKVGNKSYKCKVTVINPSLNATKESLMEGKTFTLKLSGATAKKYTSSNKKIATVSSKGKITAKKVGKVTIKVTDSKKRTYKCTVTVTVNPDLCKHTWKAATCTKPKTCSKCGKTTGSAKGHNYQWVVTKAAAVGVAGLKENKCSLCGHVKETASIPALEDKGKETAWVYSDSTHRYKTMYDGTVVYEELITVGIYSVWGYYDDAAASAMNEAVIYMLQNTKDENGELIYDPFVIDSSYYEDAKFHAFAYAIKGSSSAAYHSNHGGLPNVEDNKRYITLSDGDNQGNYIACFVYDSCGENPNYTYGKYWTSHFGTYYASGNF